jgi:NAD(P)-dependent dehydrogenase (short-subunit alcohol dehydrogenase family)
VGGGANLSAKSRPPCTKRQEPENALAEVRPRPEDSSQAENWDYAINLLLRGPLFGIKHSVGPMRAQGGGSIVNISSISGVTTSGPVGYCVGKARDIAEACLFLCTEAGAFPTGTELRIDGGMTLMAQMNMENTLPGSVGSPIAAAVHEARGG